MIAQRCPQCGSRRLRRGYRDTLLLLRLIGVYNLLCDNCNLLFRGLAVPGTVPPRHHRRHHHRGGHDGGDAGRGD